MQIRFEGYDALERKLGAIAAGTWFAAALLSAGVHIYGKVSKYPTRSSRPQPFVSDKQRRGFFARLRAGEIEVPYRRGISPGSERLGQSWTVKARDGGKTVVVGNDTSYGPLVQDKSQQTAYHRETGWQTAQDVIEKERAAVTRGVANELRKALGRA